MKGEKRHFYEDSKSDQNKGNLHGSRIHQVVRHDYLLDPDHIQSTRLDVDIPNTQEVEGCTNRTKNQVVKSGSNSRLLPIAINPYPVNAATSIST